MVTKVDHGNHRSNDHGNDRSYVGTTMVIHFLSKNKYIFLDDF